MTSKRYNNFVVVGVYRTGSTALARLAGMHAQAVCGWEWTQHVVPWRAVAVAEAALAGDFTALAPKHARHVSSQVGEETAWIGYRRLFRASAKWALHPSLAPSLLADAFRGHLEWLARRPDIHVVHIRRRRNLSWLRSKYLADDFGLYHAGQAYPRDARITIPLAEAVARLRLKAWIDERLAALERTSPYMLVDYEHLEEDPEAVYRRIERFLGLEPGPFDASILGRRQSGGTAPEQQIENFAELERALAERALSTG